MEVYKVLWSGGRHCRCGKAEGSLERKVHEGERMGRGASDREGRV